MFLSSMTCASLHSSSRCSARKWSSCTKIGDVSTGNDCSDSASWPHTETDITDSFRRHWTLSWTVRGTIFKMSLTAEIGRRDCFCGLARRAQRMLVKHFPSARAQLIQWPMYKSYPPNSRTERRSRFELYHPFVEVAAPVVVGDVDESFRL